MKGFRWFALAVCGLIAVMWSASVKSESDATPRPDSPNQAAAFWYQIRLSADGTMPDNAIMAAKAQRDAMMQPEGAGIFQGSWTWLGPGNIGGRIRAIVIHPTTPTTMWLGSVGGGVWKTTNGGASWVPLDDFLPAIGVNCMAIEPTNPDVLYAGTGEGFFNTGLPGSSNNAFKRGAGIFKSFDGGVTWTQLASTATPNFYFINRIAISPTDSNILLVASNNGIFRSIDGGNSFLQISGSKTYDVKFHPTDGSKVVAGRSDGLAQYSNDGGQSFLPASGTAGERVELAYSLSNPAMVFAAITSPVGGGHRVFVYRSTNGGASYTLMTTGSSPVSTYHNYNSTIWVDPTLPTRLLVGGVQMYRSTDSGTTLTQAFSSLHADHHMIVSDPGYNGSTNKIVYFGHDGGISKTTDVTGASSTNLNNNLGITQFYGGAVNNTSGRIVAGAQDNGTNLFTGGVNTWTYNVYGGDGGHCASDPTDANVFYAESQYANMRRSNNGGTSFPTSVAPPESGSAGFNFIPYFMLDPNNANRMYACGGKIWRSNNIKNSPPSWTMVKDVIPGTFAPVPQAHFDALDPLKSSTISVAEGNPDIVYVGYNNGQVWKTANGTAGTPTWTRLDNNAGPLPDRYVSRIVIDRNNHSRIYVAFMGWTADNVWRSTDGGTTWQDITGSGISKIPSAPVGGFAVHKTKPGWLYAGTDIGIFTSSDDGLTWTTSTDGPNTAPIAELIWKNDSTLLAVTHGRGIYSATINTSEEPVGPKSFVFLKGSRTSGGLDEIFFADDAYLVGRPGAVLVSTQPPLEIELATTSPIATTTQLRFVIESSATATVILQKVLLYDYTLPGYVEIDARALGTTDSTADVVATGDPNRFIEASTRAMKAKLTFRATGAVLVYPWNVKLDQCKWILSP